MSKHEKTDKEETNPGGSNFQATVFNKTAALAVITMRGANFFQKFLVYTCYVVGALALV